MVVLKAEVAVRLALPAMSTSTGVAELFRLRHRVRRCNATGIVMLHYRHHIRHSFVLASQSYVTISIIAPIVIIRFTVITETNFLSLFFSSFTLFIIHNN